MTSRAAVKVDPYLDAKAEVAAMQQKAKNTRKWWNTDGWNLSDSGSLISMILAPMVLAILSFVFGLISLVLGTTGTTQDSARRMSVQMTYMSFTPQSYDIRNAFSVNPSLFAGSLLIVGAAMYVAQIVLRSMKATWYMNYISKYKTDPVKWILDSLFTPATVSLTIILWGVHDVGTVLTTFVALHLAILYHWCMIEADPMATENGERKLTLGNWFAPTWAMSITLVPFFISVFSNTDVGQSPTLNWALTLAAIGFAGQFVTGILYDKASDYPPLSSGATPKGTWIKYDNVGALFAFSKVVALFLIGMAYTDDNGWLANHAQTAKCLVELFPLETASASTVATFCPGFSTPSPFTIR